MMVGTRQVWGPLGLDRVAIERRALILLDSVFI